jgi:hypothetical protein
MAEKPKRNGIPYLKEFSDSYSLSGGCDFAANAPFQYNRIEVRSPESIFNFF